jgi:hypothetical protein
MDSPQNHIWGPHLWAILHSAAERIGSKSLNRLPAEESRLWTGLLSSLRYSLPCPLCKKHYSDYYSTTPIRAVNVPFIRQWLYDLHCQVNTRTGKENTLTIENVAELYSKPFNFGYHRLIVTDQMNCALRVGWSKREDIQRTIRLFDEMKRFYDFF